MNNSIVCDCGNEQFVGLGRYTKMGSGAVQVNQFNKEAVNLPTIWCPACQSVFQFQAGHGWIRAALVTVGR